MDVDEPNWNQATAQQTPELANSMNEALSLLNAPPAGGFPTVSSLLRAGVGERHRTELSVVYPPVELRNELVTTFDRKGNPVTLFHMETPLICQLISLKPFFVPENRDFFVKWIQNLHARCSDPKARAALFAGGAEAEEWFSQTLPAMDLSNPLEGVMQSFQFAKLGR
jgi:hypothetical protein